MSGGEQYRPHDLEDLPPLVRIRCEECGTETTVRREEAREKLHTHDDFRHDGERTAGLKVQTEEGYAVVSHPADVQEGVVTDGGCRLPHGCDICSEEFDAVDDLLDHDCRS